MDESNEKKLIGVKHIRLIRKENEQEEKLVDSYQSANKVLQQWAKKPLKTPVHSKCEFEITFEDNKVYAGEYDFRRWRTDSHLCRLESYILNNLMFHAGLREPRLFPKGEYQRYLNHEGQHRIDPSRAWLETYDVGQGG